MSAASRYCAPGRRHWSSARPSSSASSRGLGARCVRRGRARRGVLISGEAGVGKSRLLAALVDEALLGGATVLELHGSPFHPDVGFHPVRTLIEYRCGITDDDGPVSRLEYLAGEIASVGLSTAEALPLLAPLMGIAPAAGYEPVAVEGQRLQEQIAEAARGYIDACAPGGPAVIVAENLHWFDDATPRSADDARGGRAARRAGWSGPLAGARTAHGRGSS